MTMQIGMARRGLFALALCLMAAPAWAEHACPTGTSSGNSLDGVCAITLGASSGTVLNAYPQGANGYRAITIDNESGSATIAVCFGASCTPALNTAGSFTVAPGYTRTWTIPYGAGGGFNDQMNGIAGAASTPVTVQAQ